MVINLKNKHYEYNNCNSMPDDDAYSNYWVKKKKGLRS